MSLEDNQFLTSPEEDFEALCSATYRKGGWKAKQIGSRWRDLVKVALVEQPQSMVQLLAESEDLIKVGPIQEAWEKRVKTKVKLYGFGFLTMLLVSLAIRLIVELIIWWLKNKNRPEECAHRLRDFLDK